MGEWDDDSVGPAWAKYRSPLVRGNVVESPVRIRLEHRVAAGRRQLSGNLAEVLGSLVNVEINS